MYEFIDTHVPETSCNNACGRRWSCSYARRSTHELVEVLTNAQIWVREHRLRVQKSAQVFDELFPPVTMHIPPLQNMTSAYSPKPQ